MEFIENTPEVTADIKRFAVLIDAENVGHRRIGFILEHIEGLGETPIKRIYGDWTQTQMSCWKSAIQNHGLQPIQQFSPVSGKSATDFAMVINAMDILYKAKVDGFVLVTSDSDFASLALRLRESGKEVHCIGEQKTPGAMRAACSHFTLIESLLPTPPLPDRAPGTLNAPAPEFPDDALMPGLVSQLAVETKPIGPKPIDATTRELFERAYAFNRSTNVLALGELGQRLHLVQPHFNHKSYGFKTLTAMVESIPWLSISVFGDTTLARLLELAPAPEQAKTARKAARKASQPQEPALGHQMDIEEAIEHRQPQLAGL